MTTPIPPSPMVASTRYLPASIVPGAMLRRATVIGPWTSIPTPTLRCRTLHAPGALPFFRRRLSVLLRPSSLRILVRDWPRRSVGAPHRALRRRHRRSRPRDAPRGCRGLAHPARARRRLLLGLRPPLYRSRAGGVAAR